MRLQNILILADGDSIHTERWIDGLTREDGVKISLLTMNPKGVRASLRENTDVQIICVAPSRITASGGNYSYLFNLFKIRKQVRIINPDVIISIYLTSYGLMAALVKGKAFLVHVMIGSDVMVAPQCGWHYRFLARFAIRCGNLFVSASRTMYERLQQIQPLSSDAVLVQQYGIEDWILDFPPREKRYTFISNRAWVENSNIPLVMELFSSASGESTLALAGGAGVIEGVQSALLQDKRVTLLGHLSHGRVVDAVAQSAFFFSLTTSDGMSLSLLEAMAVGSIPIVSDIPPNREWVRDGENGFLIDLTDVESAKRQIQRAQALSAEKMHDMRETNRQLVREKGSFTTNMEKFFIKLKSAHYERIARLERHKDC
jgi:glycosyltransferase involved in cell wall biosynthesis